MKKKYFFIGGGIVLLGILSYFIFSGPYFDSQIRFCMNMSSLQASCVGSIAIERNDPKVCTKTFGKWDIRRGDSIKRSDCIDYYVEQTGNQTACDLLSFKNIKGNEINYYEINNCRVKSISKNPDPKICDGISETWYRHQCYYDLAVNHGQTYYCGNLIGKVKDPVTNEELDWTTKQQECTMFANTKYWELQNSKK